MKKLLLLLMLLPFLAFAQTDLVSWNPTTDSNLEAVLLNSTHLIAYPVSGEGFTPSRVSSGVQGTTFPNGNNLDLNKYFQYSIAAYNNNKVTIREIRFDYSGSAKRHLVRYSKNANFSSPVTLAYSFNNQANDETVFNGNIVLPASQAITLNPGERIYIRIYAYHGNKRVIKNTLVINGTATVPGVGTAAELYCNAYTVWDGNAWSNGVPTESKDAIFTGNYTQNGGAFTACSMFVTETAQVLFKNKSTAFVTHNVNVEETASLTFESSSNLVQIEDTPNVGNVTFKRFGSRLKKLDYTFWSSPVKGSQTLLAFSPATLTNRFYTYYTSTNDYQSQPSPATQTWITGKSYLIRMPNEITGPQATAYNVGGYRFAFEGIWTGIPNNGNVKIPLEYYTDQLSYNGVGNPYPSPISITDFINANLDNIEGTIWTWRKTNNPDETSYCTITKLGYIANNAPGGGGNNGNDGNDLIGDPFMIDEEGVFNTGQGFIVRAKTNQDLVFTNSMRKTNNYENFFRTTEAQNTPPESNAVIASRIWFSIANANGNLFSQAMVGYTSEATLGYDNGLDGKAFTDGTICFYSVIEGTSTEDTKLAIQGRPGFNVDDVVLLGFKTEVAGEFAMKLDRFDGLFKGDQDIFINDKLTGAAHDIRNGSFIFSSEVGTFEKRFEILYKQPGNLGVDTEIAGSSEMVVFSEGEQVKVIAAEEIKSITVYDIQGKILWHNNAVNSAIVSLHIAASQQVVIVNAVLGNNNVISRKILMK